MQDSAEPVPRLERADRGRVLRAQRRRAAHRRRRPHRRHRQQLRAPVASTSGRRCSPGSSAHARTSTRAILEADRRASRASRPRQRHRAGLQPLDPAARHRRATGARRSAGASPTSERRFGREPEGMWLPETAVDAATLRRSPTRASASRSSSPHQARARRVRRAASGTTPRGGALRPDAAVPRAALDGDRAIAVFFYDGPIAARPSPSTRLLAHGEQLADRLAGRLRRGARGHDEVLHIATDGETLRPPPATATWRSPTRCASSSARGDVELVNYGEALERVPPAWEVRDRRGHVLELRARRRALAQRLRLPDGRQPGWNQAWRAPLRAALDGLRDALGALFERERGGAARATRGPRATTTSRWCSTATRRRAGDFLRRARRPRRSTPTRRVRRSSCSRCSATRCSCTRAAAGSSTSSPGLETVQVLQYAARAIQLARDATGVDLEPEFEERARAGAVEPARARRRRRVYETLVGPQRRDARGRRGPLRDRQRGLRRAPGGRQRLLLPLSGSSAPARGPLRPGGDHARAAAARELPRRARRSTALCCVLHFGGADFRCGVGPCAAPRSRRARAVRSSHAWIGSRSPSSCARSTARSPVASTRCATSSSTSAAASPRRLLDGAPCAVTRATISRSSRRTAA